MPRSSRIGRKPPAALKEARSYRRLAAWARCHNYRRVSRHTVKGWVASGALPNAVPIHQGFGPPRMAQRVDMGRQLLRLCHYRYDDGLGRLHIVSANLWLDGYDVPLDKVRAGMHWALDDLEVQG